MTEFAVTDAQDVIDGLVCAQARISPKYFYDAKGSRLFEQITRLPEYYPTRVERDIMARHGPALAQHIGAGGVVIELGAGNCEKAGRLCQALRPGTFVALDISTAFLHGAVGRMRKAFPGMSAHAVAADITQAIVLPDVVPRAHRLVFYPGSSIGNFNPHEAGKLLRRVRRLIDTDGALLIGVDLIKDVAALHAAYNDADGITAAFNRNVLDHVNRLIDADFDCRQWQHVAFFNERASRIEMHLEALMPLRVRWPGGERRFASGERIHTEYSYKYERSAFVRLLAEAGFARTHVWTDDDAQFAVMVAKP